MKLYSKILLLISLSSLSFNLYAQTDCIPTHGFAAFDESGVFHPYKFNRHAVGDDEIRIGILYSGICHSDLHNVHGDWRKEEYPMMPGHEIAGRVVAVGKDVTKFKVGDYAGVGCIINSCHVCDYCLNGQEHYCSESVSTYHDHDPYHDNEPTQGGYSDNIVVSQDYAIAIPANADMEKVAPLLCAGITTYSPIKYAGVKSGNKVGVAGFGGLGNMAVKYLKALGADVTVFDISEDKREAAKEMGASRYVNVNDSSAMASIANEFDFIISTIPSAYDPMTYMKMLKWNGQMCIVGIPSAKDMPQLSMRSFIGMANRRLFGSRIGSIGETQEMMDYSVAHGIYPDVEVIKADADLITDAYEKVKNGEVKFRYVIDMSTLEK